MLRARGCGTAPPAAAQKTQLTVAVPSLPDLGTMAREILGEEPAIPATSCTAVVGGGAGCSTGMMTRPLTVLAMAERTTTHCWPWRRRLDKVPAAVSARVRRRRRAACASAGMAGLGARRPRPLPPGRPHRPPTAACAQPLLPPPAQRPPRPHTHTHTTAPTTITALHPAPPPTQPQSTRCQTCRRQAEHPPAR